MLHICVEVGGVSVEDELAERDQWVITVGPDLRDVSHVVFVSFGVLFRHRLDVEGPGGFLTGGNPVKEVLSVVVLGPRLNIFDLLVAESLDSDIALDVVLDEIDFSLFIDPSESV